MTCWQYILYTTLTLLTIIASPFMVQALVNWMMG